MYFISTRGKKEKIKGSQAIINGICSDGGLYVPESFPDVSDKLDNLVNLSYKDLCFEILKLYLDDFTEEELKNCINKFIYYSYNIIYTDINYSLVVKLSSFL